MVSSSSIPFTKTFRLLFYLFFFSFNATILNEEEAALPDVRWGWGSRRHWWGPSSSSPATSWDSNLLWMHLQFALSHTAGTDPWTEPGSESASVRENRWSECIPKSHSNLFDKNSISYEEVCMKQFRQLWRERDNGPHCLTEGDGNVISKWENLNLGFFHLTHGVDGLQAPEAGWVLRAKHQLSQVLACAQTQRDRLRTGQIDDWRWLSSWDLAG